MNIQIIGTKKSRDTQKAERFFKERKVDYHFKDLNESGLAKGELDNIVPVIPLEELIDRDGQQFKKEIWAIWCLILRMNCLMIRCF
jgi:arsenate reductase (glutaredoxin)